MNTEKGGAIIFGREGGNTEKGRAIFDFVRDTNLILYVILI